MIVLIAIVFSLLLIEHSAKAQNTQDSLYLDPSVDVPADQLTKWISKRQVNSATCPFPGPLPNGSFRFHPSRCNDSEAMSTPLCKQTPGVGVPNMWVLYNNCNQGYQLSPLYPASVCRNGKWAPKTPTCQLVYKPECTNNNNCSTQQMCRNETCVDPCETTSCGANAECRTEDHLAACYCKPGYEGDPITGCNKPECVTNNNCPSEKMCLNKKCVDPCKTTSCGENEECRTEDHLATCYCKPGYEGSSITGCNKPECVNNYACPSEKMCLNKKCMDPCKTTSCGENEECRTEDHFATCYCKPGYEGSPITGCNKPECINNYYCTSEKMCLNKKCVDPCETTSCGANEECRTQNHLATCYCKPGYEGSPITGCKKTECVNNYYCPSHKSCVNKKCVDPCKTTSCGANAECRTQNHLPSCSCKPGYEGNPVTGCRLIKRNKKFIAYTDKTRTWQQSKDHCKSLGMDLATIENQQEQDMLYNVIKGDIGFMNSGQNVWIGGSDLRETGTFTWESSNAPVTYTNWRTGEPDHFKLPNGESQKCVFVNTITGKWFDAFCFSTWHHACVQYY